jgi:hypothetical protein
MKIVFFWAGVKVDVDVDVKKSNSLKSFSDEA